MEVMISPETIYLHLTKACNLHCQYCYFSAGEAQQDELLTGEIDSLLKDIFKLSPKRVVFTGGEPLLRDDLLEIASFFKSLDRENKIRLCLTTNGTLIKSDNAASLVKVFNEIRISIDSFEEVNDELRGQGSFKKAKNGLHEISRAGGNPVAFITITSLNISTLKEFMSYLLSEGFSQIHISQLNLTGRARGKSELACKYDAAIKIVEEFWHERFGLKLEKKTIPDAINCGVGKFITVHPDGSVYPCHLLAFPELRVGNVRKDKLYSIFHYSKVLTNLRELNFCQMAKRDEHFNNLVNNGQHACIGRLAQNDKIRGRISKYKYNSFVCATNTVN